MTEIAPDLKALLPSRMASSHEPDKRPLEYLWVFDPEGNGTVHLETYKDRHPAHYPTHRAMAPHVTHPERTQGYAWPILGASGRPTGWRILDEEFGTDVDPHVKRRVLNALAQREPGIQSTPDHHLPHPRYHGDPAR